MGGDKVRAGRGPPSPPIVDNPELQLLDQTLAAEDWTLIGLGQAQG
jgi:hypothetical protein